MKKKTVVFFEHILKSEIKEPIYKNWFDRWWNERNPEGLNGRDVTFVWILVFVFISIMCLLMYFIKIN